MSRLSSSEKIGCATLAITFLAAIANWLSVPGILDRTGSVTTANRRGIATPAIAERSVHREINGFAFDFVGCAHVKELTSCHMNVMNLDTMARVGRVKCGASDTTVVDYVGFGYSARTCWLGVDSGFTYAEDSLAPGVKYQMSAEFREVNLGEPTLRYVQFTFHDESRWWFQQRDFVLGFKDVPVLMR